MSVIQKYILREFIKPFIWCFILFISLSWIIDLFDHLDEIIKARVPIFVLCDYYFSMTPFILINVSPIIIILSVVFTLNNLNKHNEIMAIKAIGINLWRIIWIFLTFGLIISAFSFIVNERIKPESYLHAVNLKEEYFRQDAKKVKNEFLNDINFYGSNNRIFIINKYDVKRQEMTNVTISEHDRDNKLKNQIVAKKAQWVEGYWIFYDCIITEYAEGKTKPLPPVHYKEKVFDLDEKPKDIKRANLQPDLMSYWQLKKYVNRLKNNGFKANKELVILYNKIAFPLANFLLVFFAVPFTLTRQRSGNAFLGITVSLVIGLSYWGINAVCLTMGKIGILPALLAAWLANILFFITGVCLIETVKK
ncbi:MAG: LPS export ABC transporter permease LptG [Candidatus Omnitrophica bacterium]|nr:LPS export ABC transporter permease LptG [Candidatus Omnitrophota bacterium]MBU1925872.1 LPS export ABC transporter permease LptG [Candidatus Omnitrophota bacterium]MBU2063065.1 LPS export ABC transporter permease LptG [Candidatus Omnitrophota bacterium]